MGTGELSRQPEKMLWGTGCDGLASYPSGVAALIPSRFILLPGDKHWKENNFKFRKIRVF